jgi:exosortase B
MTAQARSGSEAPSRRWPIGLDPWVAALLMLGAVAMVAPMVWDWSQGPWAIETQGHEAIIIGVSIWLVFRRREELVALASRSAPLAGGAMLMLALAMYVAGRMHGVFRLELISVIVLCAALLVSFKGFAALRQVWFAFFFLLFAIPLPFALVLAVTGPMKTGVSILATQFLDLLGYPIARSGVVITVGQYQLLVNEACAGLQTMFTLEAMGLLYASLMNHSSLWRNTLLVLLVVPIALCANVVRVVSLALVTYYLGDDAGQGFLHGFAGIVLFLTALALVVAVDGLLGRVLAPRKVSA